MLVDLPYSLTSASNPSSEDQLEPPSPLTQARLFVCLFLGRERSLSIRLDGERSEGLQENRP